MSKVNAFICDYNNHLVEEQQAFGVSPVEDLFDKIHSFKTINSPAKADIHYCVECYKACVTGPAGREIDRRNNEDAYKKKLEELSYGLRSQTVRNYWAKARKKSS